MRLQTLRAAWGETAICVPLVGRSRADGASKKGTVRSTGHGLPGRVQPPVPRRETAWSAPVPCRRTPAARSPRTAHGANRAHSGRWSGTKTLAHVGRHTQASSASLTLSAQTNRPAPCALSTRHAATKHAKQQAASVYTISGTPRSEGFRDRIAWHGPVGRTAPPHRPQAVVPTGSYRGLHKSPPGKRNHYHLTATGRGKESRRGQQGAFELFSSVARLRRKRDDCRSARSPSGPLPVAGVGSSPLRGKQPGL